MTARPARRGRPKGSRYEEGRSPMSIQLTTEERDLIVRAAELDALEGPVWARSQLVVLARKRIRAEERARKNGSI